MDLIGGIVGDDHTLVGTGNRHTGGRGHQRRDAVACGSFISFVEQRGIGGGRHVGDFANLPFSQRIQEQTAAANFAAQPHTGRVLADRHVAQPLEITEEHLTGLMRFHVAINIDVHRTAECADDQIMPPAIVPIAVGAILTPLSFDESAVHKAVIVNVHVHDLAIVIARRKNRAELSDATYAELRIDRAVGHAVQRLHILVRQIGRGKLNIRLRHGNAALNTLRSPNLREAFQPLNADMRFIGAVEDASLRILRRANVGRAGEGLIAIQIDSRAKIAEGDMKVVDTAELHAVGVFDVQHNMVFGRFDDQRPAGNRDRQRDAFGVSRFQQHAVRGDVERRMQRSPLFRKQRTVPCLVDLIGNMRHGSTFRITFPV